VETIDTDLTEPSRETQNNEEWKRPSAADDDEFGEWARAFISVEELDKLLASAHPSVKAWAVEPFPAFLTKSVRDHQAYSKAQRKKLKSKRRAALSNANQT
jgi:hypothetical protein